MDNAQEASLEFLNASPVVCGLRLCKHTHEYAISCLCRTWTLEEEEDRRRSRLPRGVANRVPGYLPVRLFQCMVMLENVP